MKLKLLKKKRILIIKIILANEATKILHGEKDLKRPI